MRIILSATDLIYPSIQFTSINYSKNFITYNLMGCIDIGNLKIYEMNLNLEEIIKYYGNNFNEIRKNNYHRIKIIKELGSNECKFKG
jgi:hypothetical protein